MHSQSIRWFAASRVPALAACALVFGACSMEGEESGERLDPVPVVAEIETVDGARVTFLDEGEADGEPVIGVEIVSATETPVTDGVLAQEPSALELYLALVPGAQAGAEVPPALERDHERLAAHSSDHARTPRRLVVPVPRSESVRIYDCDLASKWRKDFQSWSPSLDGERIETWESRDSTGYIGYAPKFYFDVCNPSSNPPVGVVSPRAQPRGTVAVRVQRRPGASYAWSTFNQQVYGLLNTDRRWRYYRNSSSCSSYQYRLVVNSTGWYHRAARWSDEWSCQITGRDHTP